MPSRNGVRTLAVLPFSIFGLPFMASTLIRISLLSSD
jgi:hypothetical protein